MALSSSSIISFLVLLAFSVMVCLPSTCSARSGTMVGAKMDIPNVESDPEIQDLGRYCVEEYNKKRENSAVSFVRVVEGQKQVVAGIMYYLRIEAMDDDAGIPKRFDATVVVKAWLRSKELLSFSKSSA